ncbi:DegV family protein [Deinococcus radiophilus]|uniref:DegV family protein n=1 Tax=Deinococcus radiophilus TaxID=32062 RepID=A0A3S0KDF6_9DEIO|nr:DegV family protein [Deinococcus radiophilus]RTR28284.1 DegV family protein [Deinococcus radiophilus]UFA51145.1 DegV family protein [Deinococcus radiophilus]
MIAVVTDSTCDLPPAVLSDMGVHMLPLSVLLQDRPPLCEWNEVDPDEVYKRLQAGESVATRPVEARTFRECYRNLLTRYDAVVSVHLSSRISNTVQHARQAVVALNELDRIRVVDSGVSSVLLASAVLSAQRESTQGGDLVSVAQAAVDTLRDQYGEFTVPSLDYLRRGGRISPVQYAVGNLLDMRPILGFDSEGHLKALRRVRSGESARNILGTLYDRFGKDPVRVAVGLAGRDHQRLHELRRHMQRSGLNIRAGRTQLIGSVIGAHTGPGMFAFVAEPYDE